MTSHLNIGGVATYTLSLSRELIRRGHRIAIASGGGVLASDAAAAGMELWVAPLHTSAEFSLPVWRAGHRLAGRLRHDPVDVIHAHSRVAQVVAARLSRHLGIPYVTTWHGFFRPNLGRRLWPCTGDRTIAISEPVRRHLMEVFRVPEERIRLIPNGVDTARFASLPDGGAVRRYREAQGLPPDRPVIGGVGRLAAGRVKGFDLLLGAAQRLLSTVPDLHILIVGDGPRRPSLEEKVEHLGLHGRVHLVGTAEDIRLPLAAMDVFVFPVRWNEGFGLSLVEAMAAGKPVVATRVGAVPDIVRHGQDGWLVEPEDVVSLADGIAHLLRDPSAARRMAQAAQERAREAFSLARMADQVEAVYREVTSGE